MMILLHIVQATVPGNKPGLMQVIPFPKGRESIHPLACIGFAPTEHNGKVYCELTYAAQAGMYRCAELYEDVVNALARGVGGSLLIRVPLTEAIEQAAAIKPPVQRPQAFPMKSTAGALGAIDSALGEMGYQKDGPAVEEGVAWDDAGLGEKLPAYERREPKRGDLKIVPAGEDVTKSGVLIMAWNDDPEYAEGEPGLACWDFKGVPAELRPAYSTVEAARTAIKLAGYSRRLLEE